MIRALSSKQCLVAAVVVALSVGAGLVEATTSIDPEDQYPDCEVDMDFFGDGYCDRATLNVEECGFDGGEILAGPGAVPPSFRLLFCAIIATAYLPFISSPINTSEGAILTHRATFCLPGWRITDVTAPGFLGM